MNSAQSRKRLLEKTASDVQRGSGGDCFQQLNRRMLLHPTGAQVFENHTNGADRLVPENRRSISSVGVIADEKIDPKRLSPSERGDLARLQIKPRQSISDFETRCFNITNHHDLGSLNRARPMLLDFACDCLGGENLAELGEQLQCAQFIEVDQRPSIENADSRARHAVQGFGLSPTSSPRVRGLRHASSDTPSIHPTRHRMAAARSQILSPKPHTAPARVRAFHPLFVRAYPDGISKSRRRQTIFSK